MELPDEEPEEPDAPGLLPEEPMEVAELPLPLPVALPLALLPLLPEPRLLLEPSPPVLPLPDMALPPEVLSPAAEEAPPVLVPEDTLLLPEDEAELEPLWLPPEDKLLVLPDFSALLPLRLLGAVDRLLPWPAPVLPPPALSEEPLALLPPMLLLPVPPAAWLLLADWLPEDRLPALPLRPVVALLLPRARSLSLPRPKSELPLLLSSEDRLDPRPALLWLRPPVEEALGSPPEAPDCEPMLPGVPWLPKRCDPSPDEAPPSPPPWLLPVEPLLPCSPVPWLPLLSELLPPSELLPCEPPRLLRHWLNSSLNFL